MSEVTFCPTLGPWHSKLIRWLNRMGDDVMRWLRQRNANNFGSIDQTHTEWKSANKWRQGDPVIKPALIRDIGCMFCYWSWHYNSSWAQALCPKCQTQQMKMAIIKALNVKVWGSRTQKMSELLRRQLKRQRWLQQKLSSICLYVVGHTV